MAETPNDLSPATASTKPYFLRALYEWCTDNGFTPYVAVVVDAGTRVPNEYVKDGQIVLNVSFDATSNLRIANDFLTFAARFGGMAREISVPIERVAAIYARENGQGMGFEVTDTGSGSAQGQKSASTAPALAVSPAASPSAAPALASAEAAASGPHAVASVVTSKPAPEPPKKGGKPKFTVVK